MQNNIYSQAEKLNLEPHQLRLLMERQWLSERYDAIQGAVKGATFLLLPVIERNLLQAQERIMARYLDVLDKRIALFMPNELIEEKEEELLEELA